MKKIVSILVVVTFCFFNYQNLAAQNPTGETETSMDESQTEDLKTYVIEREIPGAGNLTPEELKGISQKSCTVLDGMGTGIAWMHSYVTDDKVYCVYKAKSPELIREHAKKGGFPVNSIQELSTTIGPVTAKE